MKLSKDSWFFVSDQKLMIIQEKIYLTWLPNSHELSKKLISLSNDILLSSDGRILDFRPINSLAHEAWSYFQSIPES